MKKQIKRWCSVLFAAALLCGLLTFTTLSASASENGGLTIRATSNYFPAAEQTYIDFSRLEDGNGDVYITVAYEMLADEKYLVNIDIGELTYDPDVLEWDVSYNRYGSGYGARLNLFPFAAENDIGTGVYRLTEPGRIVGNFSSVNPPAWAYGENHESVIVVKAVFKLLDRTVSETTVNCNLEYLALCDDSAESAYLQYQVIYAYEINNNLQLDEALSTEIFPEPADPFLVDGVPAQGVYDGIYYVDGFPEAYYGFITADGVLYYFNMSDTGVPYSGIYEGYYYQNGVPTHAGVVQVGDDLYFAGNNGALIKNRSYFVKAEYTNGLVARGSYEFDADGKLILPEPKNGIVDGVYYVNDVPTYAGVVQDGDDFYFAGNNGVLIKDRTYFVKAEYTNGLVARGSYEFDADGKIILPEPKNGIVDGVYYVNDVPTYAGVIQVGDDLYFAGKDGVLMKSRTYFVKTEYANGLVARGSYEFDADGKMILPEPKNGIVDGVYYVNDVPTYAGVIRVGDDLYFAGKDGVLMKSRTYFVKTEYANGLVARGSYEFDADGKMILPEPKNGIVDGIYYVNDVPTYAGLLEIDGDYYFARANGIIVKDQTYFVKAEYTNGLLPRGSYTFDADGKIVL